MKSIKIFEIKSKINTMHEIRIWKCFFKVDVVAVGMFDFDCYNIYSGKDIEIATKLYTYFYNYRNELRKKEKIKWNL